MAPITYGRLPIEREFEEFDFEIHLAVSVFGKRRRYQVRKLENGQPRPVKLREEHPPLVAYGLEVRDTLELLEAQGWRIRQQRVDVDLDRLASWVTLVSTAAQIQGLEYRLEQARSLLRAQTLAAVDAGLPITIAARSARRSREWIYKEKERERDRRRTPTPTNRPGRRTSPPKRSPDRSPAADGA